MTVSGPLNVLVVCTANECRSPLAAAVIERQWMSSGLTDVELRVMSAGVDAMPGSPWCEQSAAVGEGEPSSHASRELTVEDLESATLVVPMDRTHRGVVARMLPSIRPRMFTLVQAALLAEHVGRELEWNGPAPGAPPLPELPGERVAWLVAEMDAARGALAGMGDEALDIEDVHGEPEHAEQLARVRESAQTLADWMVHVVRMDSISTVRG